MRVVVAGATGNIGSSLVRALGAGGYEVVGLARRVPASAPGSEPVGVEWVSADLTEPAGLAALRSALVGADAYVHLAWPLQPMRRPDYLFRAGPVTMLACARAALDAGVGRVVHLSSVAAYRPRGQGVLVDEHWPLGGVASSRYARHKTYGERILASLTAERGAAQRVAVLRPCLVAQRSAGGYLLRCGVPALVPGAALRRLPAVPHDPTFGLQMVHSDDVAAAVVAVLERRAHGAFNLAGDGVVTSADIARALGATAVPVPSRAVRALATAAWRARLQPMDPGWIDMALRCPHVSSRRAVAELDWHPRPATTVLSDLVAGMAAGEGADTPAMRPRTVRGEVVTALRDGSVARRRRN